MKRTLACLTLLLSTSALASAQDIAFTNTELRGGVVMMSTGAGGNVGFLTGDDGTLLVDDLLPGTGPLIEAAIAELGEPGAPRFILNTHWHGDHTATNGHFQAQGTTVAAHHNIRARIEASDDAWTQGDGMLPLLTFGHDLTFHMNGQTVEAHHVARAHTDGDAIVLFREANVLHAGDVLFNGLFPFVDLESGGSVEGFIAAMEYALEMTDAETQIIPGHGPLATRDDLQTSIDMVRSVQGIIRPMVESGMSVEDVLAAEPLADFHDDWSWGFVCTPRMVTILYNDAAGIDENWPEGMSCRAPAAAVEEG